MLPVKHLSSEEHHENVTKPPSEFPSEVAELCNMHKELMLVIKDMVVSRNTPKIDNPKPIGDNEHLQIAWREVARVLDRIFLILYAVAIILSLLWLLPKPKY